MFELKISDIPIIFPNEPYPQQIYMMTRIINSLNNKENCLLELPTGSGKTIALLCSTLSWLKISQSKNSLDIENKENEMAVSADDLTEIDKLEEFACGVRIYFGTRTHKQIGQVVRELKRSAYSNIRMSILSGRNQSCLNREVLMSKDIDQKCKDLCKSKEGCFYKIKEQPLPETSWDIESIKSELQQAKICPYFQFKSWMKTADIVFCPYNYILNPFIRKSMDIDLKNNIIILDEAHNIEDICRDGASVSISQKEINLFKMQLLKILKLISKQDCYQDLVTMLDKMYELIELLSPKLFFKNEDVLKKTWDSENFVELMKNCQLHLDSIRHFKVQWNKLYKDINKVREQDESISGMSGSFIQLIDSFIMVAISMMENDNKNQNDFSVVITSDETFVEQTGEEITTEVWILSKKRKSNVLKPNFVLNIWCMNPGIVFKEISDISRSIILTSGTLSPMMSFQKELDCKFSSIFEAPHIVKPNQTFLASIGHGPSGTEMKAVYSTTSKLAFQDELGRMLLKCSEIVPNGILCFLSSFVLMESLIQRWKSTRLIDEIRQQKSIFIEPRNTSEMNECMDGYYKNVKDGALLFAVFRGKASEGVDFSDDAARLVITVGIPYPSVGDPKVALKMNYNTKKNKQFDNQYLSGSEWYNIQAFRALNQAVGRCIRHREDWGAMIMIDSRFDGSNPVYKNGLCAWIKKRRNHFKSWNELFYNLQSFMNVHYQTNENKSPDI